MVEELVDQLCFYGCSPTCPGRWLEGFKPQDLRAMEPSQWTLNISSWLSSSRSVCSVSYSLGNQKYWNYLKKRVTGAVLILICPVWAPWATLRNCSRVLLWLQELVDADDAVLRITETLISSNDSRAEGIEGRPSTKKNLKQNQTLSHNAWRPGCGSSPSHTVTVLSWTCYPLLTSSSELWVTCPIALIIKRSCQITLSKQKFTGKGWLIVRAQKFSLKSNCVQIISLAFMKQATLD